MRGGERSNSLQFLVVVFSAALIGRRDESVALQDGQGRKVESPSHRANPCSTSHPWSRALLGDGNYVWWRARAE